MKEFHEDYACNFARRCYEEGIEVSDVALKVQKYISDHPTSDAQALGLLQDVGNVILSNFGLSDQVIKGISGKNDLELKKTANWLGQVDGLYLEQTKVRSQSHWWYAVKITDKVQEDIDSDNLARIVDDENFFLLPPQLDVINYESKKILGLLSLRSGIGIDTILGQKGYIPLQQIRTGAYRLLENSGVNVDEIANIMRVGEKKIVKNLQKLEMYLDSYNHAGNSIGDTHVDLRI
jgi:hypothetical protein